MLLSPFRRQTADAIAVDAPATGADTPKNATPVQHDKGFITQMPDPRLAWLFDKIKVEMDRLTTLTDIRIMLEEAPYIDGVCNKFILWTTVGKPQLTFTGGSKIRAERIVNDMLDRISYHSRRGDYLHAGLFLEAFLKKQLSFTTGVVDAFSSDPKSLMREFRAGLALGQIDDILGPLPAETMFRNSDKQDLFPNPEQAFYQVPEELNNPNMPVQHKAVKEWFHNMFILHPRWNNRRQKSHRYSRPALKSVRKAYNRTEMSATDAVVQRHLAATRLLVMYLKRHVAGNDDVGASKDEVSSFIEDFVQRYPTGFNKPGTVYITSGEHEVDSVGDLNITLSKPADIFMHFDFMSVGLMLHPVLAGFTGGEGGRITGPLIEQLRGNLAMDIEAVNAWEDNEILLPLCYFELFLHGIFDVQIAVTHDKPAFIRDIERKVMMSEVSMNALSRQSYYETMVAEKIGRSWDEEKKLIKGEQEAFGPAEPTENVNKGMNGSKKDAAKTPVQGEKP